MTLTLIKGGAPAEEPREEVLTAVAAQLREEALKLSGADPWRSALEDIADMAQEEVA